MANNENLKPFNQMSSEEAEKIQRKGGKARGRQRKELKEFKEYIKQGLKTVVTDKNGKEVTAKEAGALKVIKKYIEGDYKFVELVLKVLNEMPAEKQEITNTTPQIVVADAEAKKRIELLMNVDADKNI